MKIIESSYPFKTETMDLPESSMESFPAKSSFTESLNATENRDKHLELYREIFKQWSEIKKEYDDRIQALVKEIEIIFTF